MFPLWGCDARVSKQNPWGDREANGTFFPQEARNHQQRVKCSSRILGSGVCGNLCSPYSTKQIFWPKEGSGTSKSYYNFLLFKDTKKFALEKEDCSFAGASITEHQRLGCLSNRDLFSHKICSWLADGCLPPALYMGFSVCVCVLISSSYEVGNHLTTVYPNSLILT